MTQHGFLIQHFRLILTACALLASTGFAAEDHAVPTATMAADHAPPAPGAHGADEHASAQAGHAFVPPYWAAAPFVAILLAIALLPLIHKTHHWWERNANKLTISLILAAVTLVYYLLRGVGMGHGDHASEPGAPTVIRVLHHALLDEYIPFMVLLFCLYTVCGGIVLRGDLRATPRVNTTFLAIGALLASFVGTTGASMLLIRPLLQTNRERIHRRHTVIFFIFLVSNIGGCLLPIGDPPLFLGYLRGVPFFWTFGLVRQWVFCTILLLVVYYVWDTVAYRREPDLQKMLDQQLVEPMSVRGALNMVWLLGVVAAVAIIRPGESFYGLFTVPEYFLREAVMLAFVAVAWLTTPRVNRERNEFNFVAITEVAVLFVGIFITMQVPIEILHVKGSQLGLRTPAQFFWATGGLSSFLDNAPTYVVFFETANSMTRAAGEGVLELIGGNFMREDLLVAISLGAVFMGANTYIGNGPNFMVKSIAEQSNVRMPSFFGYMGYSIAILIPTFIAVMFFFL